MALLDWVIRRDHQRRRQLHFTDAPPVATQNVAYSYQAGIAGGYGPYTLAVTGGALPTGLTVATDTVSGTPTLVEAKTVFFSITDANGTVRDGLALEFVVHA